MVRRTYEWIALGLAALPAILGPVLFGGVRLCVHRTVDAVFVSGVAALFSPPLVFRAEIPMSIPPGSIPAGLFLCMRF
jgi:hypothetical protein